jgi:hypothetical protein
MKKRILLTELFICEEGRKEKRIKLGLIMLLKEEKNPEMKGLDCSAYL